MYETDVALLQEQRRKFHQALMDSIYTVDSDGIPSNADRSNKTSKTIARGIYDLIASELEQTESVHEKAVAQRSGGTFEVCVKNFVEATFPELQHLRPGSWKVMRLGNRSAIKSSSFAQYEHLTYLNELANANAQLAASLGNDYTVAPDVVVYRNLCTDEEINKPGAIVDGHTAKLADLRKSNGGKPILHASISAKWTMRSDRAQNSRTEALNLIRNRKGQLPHIVVVTGEPTPSRLASLALGTGDIDCVYHFALYELNEAVKSPEINDDTRVLLNNLIIGKRLKDISDLPIDLAV